MGLLRSAIVLKCYENIYKNYVLEGIPTGGFSKQEILMNNRI